jgi:uncharacterized membrane protein YuzA (DUF378 family)
MKILHIIAFILTIVGAVQWGLIGLYMFLNNGVIGWNFIGEFLDSMPMAEASVYALVGLSALLLVVTHAKDCRTCKA